MSQRREEDVSKIVQEYRNKFPNAERRVLRDAILQKYQNGSPKINIRTLNRHLSKAFNKRPLDNIKELQKPEKINKGDWFYEPKSFTEETTNPPKIVSSWDSLINDFADIGANLTEIKIGKHLPRDPQPKTARFEQVYDGEIVQGIMMLKGAKTMQTAAKMSVPDEYEAFLFTQASVKEEDVLTWQGINYLVKKVEPIYDIYVVSYRIAKLVIPFVRKSAPLNAFRFG